MIYHRESALLTGLMFKLVPVLEKQSGSFFFTKHLFIGIEQYLPVDAVALPLF